MRTVAVKDASGADMHKTFKMCTPRLDTHVMCNNYGPAMSAGGEPNDSKMALMDRTISFNLRSVAEKPVSDSEFHAHLQTANAQAMQLRFRMMMGLSAAVHMAIHNVPLLQPDMAYAKRMLDECYRILDEEYNFALHSARKRTRALQNILTMCIWKAVNEVFVYQQTSLFSEAGKPTELGRGQDWDITQLYDVIRSLRPTPEIVLMGFSQALDHSPATSQVTLNVMTAICESFGLNPFNWLRRADHPLAHQLAAQGGAQTGDNEIFMETIRLRDEANTAMRMLADRRTTPLSDGDLLDMKHCYERHRRATTVYHIRCSQRSDADNRIGDFQSVFEHVMNDASLPPDAQAGSSDDGLDNLPLFPSLLVTSAATLAQFMGIDNLSRWSSGIMAEHGVQCMRTGIVLSKMKFAEARGGGPSSYDACWIKMDGSGTYRQIASKIGDQPTINNFDISDETLKDTVFFLTTVQCKRRCTEPPNMDRFILNGFVDDDGNDIMDGANISMLDARVAKVGVRGRVDRGGGVQDPGTEASPRHPYASAQNTAFDRRIDNLVCGGRFPLANALMSNRICQQAPLRRRFENDTMTLQASTSTLVWHAQLMAEAVTRVAAVPGVGGMHEMLGKNSTAPAALIGLESPLRLPYCVDLVHISIGVDVTQRLYDSQCARLLQTLNQMHADYDINHRTVPHTALRFVGLDLTPKRRLMLSMPPSTRPLPAFNKVEVSNVSSSESEVDIYLRLKLQMGRTPTEEELAEAMLTNEGASAMPGVTGDLFDMATYRKHQSNAAVRRGFAVHHKRDDVIYAIQDEGLNFRARLSERLAELLNSVVEDDERVIAARAAVRASDAASAKAARQARVRAVNSVELPDNLEPYRLFAHMPIDPPGWSTYAMIEHQRSEAERLLAARKRQTEASGETATAAEIDMQVIAANVFSLRRKSGRGRRRV